MMQKQSKDQEKKYQEKIDELRVLQNQQNIDWFGKLSLISFL